MLSWSRSECEVLAMIKGGAVVLVAMTVILSVAGYGRRGEAEGPGGGLWAWAAAAAVGGGCDGGRSSAKEINKSTRSKRGVGVVFCFGSVQDKNEFGSNTLQNKAIRAHMLNARTVGVRVVSVGEEEGKEGRRGSV